MGKRHYLYIEMAGCFAYLALVTDAYSHKIVGWELAPSLRACNALAALRMALNSLFIIQTEEANIAAPVMLIC